MSQKSITSYTFLTNSNFQMQFSLAEESKTFSKLNIMDEVSQSIPLLAEDASSGSTSSYSWKGLFENSQVAQRDNLIDDSNGTVSSGDMTDMMNMPSIVKSFTDQSYAISYGFFDAASGAGGLTNEDQCYAYFTDSYQRWMAGLVAAYPDAAKKALHEFILPGAHDSGMNTLANCENILNQLPVQVVKDILNALCPKLKIGTDIINEALFAIRNIAITQKDSFTTMLDLGIRYFDFRPGKLYSTIQDLVPESQKNTLYHQHNFIPGASYEDFLVELLEWLDANPSEIVVVSCNTQGMAETTMHPTQTELDNVLTDAIVKSKIKENSIVTGDKNDLSNSYEQLIKAKKRLIFLNQIGASPATSKYDSYYQGNYSTLSPGNIIKALEKMNKAGQAGSTYTVLQIQGTATGVDAVILPSLVPYSLTSSPLMSTKAYFDHSTLPWLLNNVNKNLSSDYLTIVLNDFADNATVSHCISICKQRMNLL